MILALGGSNIDILARSFKPLELKASNPGVVYVTHGGVMRNIVEDLCLLGQRPVFLTGLGEDDLGKAIEARLEKVGARVFAYRKPGLMTGTYCAIAGPDGDMSAAVCDNQIGEAIPLDFVQHHIGNLPGDINIFLDANVSTKLIAGLARANPGKRLFAEAVSPDKVQRFSRELDRLFFLKCAVREARALCGTAAASPMEMVIMLLKKGIANVAITDGKNGVFYGDDHGTGHLPAVEPVNEVNATGCGDALFAGTAMLLAESHNLVTAVGFGLRCAAVAIASESPVNPDLAGLSL